MRVSNTELRRSLARYIDIANGGEPIIVDRHGQDIAALVAMNELKRWQLTDEAGEALLELRRVYSTKDDSEIFRKLVLDWKHASAAGESKTRLIKAIKFDTERIIDILSRADPATPANTLDVARAAGCDCPEAYE